MGRADTLRLQRLAGNAAVASLLARRPPAPDGSVAPPTVQREEEQGDAGAEPQPAGPAEGQVAGAAGPVAYDPADLATTGDLEGSAALVVQRDGPTPPPQVIKMVSPMVLFNDPTITPRPAAEIAAAHHRPGVVGWTTPRYTLTVPRVDATHIDVTTTIDFNIEADSTYTGPMRDVLMDHEQGHVSIGKRVAQKAFAEDLSDSLSALPDFTARGPVSAALGAAATAFTTQEGQESAAYDSIDYPRMAAAYSGARRSLAAIMRGSAAAAALVRSMRALVALGGGSGTTAARAAAAMNRVVDANDSLAPDDLSALQYNTEFKTLVDQARAASTSLAGNFTADPHVAEQLAILQSVLGGFTWTSPV